LPCVSGVAGLAGLEFRELWCAEGGVYGGELCLGLAPGLLDAYATGKAIVDESSARAAVTEVTTD
jgi:hypothetical protein